MLDLETTGLSRYYHKITEIAAIRLDKDKIKREFHTLVNPQVRIPRFITNLTGIDNKMVKDAPTIKEIMPAIRKFLGSDIIVAHNAAFDYGFLSYNSEKYLKNPLENNKLCTKKLANRLVPDLPSKKLEHLCHHFNINNQQAHRALGDVYATTELFNKFRLMLEQQNIITPEAIIKFEKSPRQSIKF